MSTHEHETVISTNGVHYQVWLEKILCYTETRIGRSSRTRMYAYEQGASAIIAIDIFGQQVGQDMSITIQVAPNTTILPLPIDDQLDMTLPDIVSVIDFASYLINRLQKPFHPSGHLEISAWDQKRAVQHGPTS